MNISKWIIAASLLFSAQVASVQGGSCNPCDPCNTCTPCDLCDVDFCDMEFCGYVDYLYWQVCRSDLDYNDDGERNYVNPGYDSGWRIGFVSQYNCWDFGLRYTDFCSKDSKDDSKFHFDFENLDIEMGYTCCLDCMNGYLRQFAGAKLVWIDEEFDSDDASDFETDYKGYGLYLGFNGRLQICEYCACDREIPISFVWRASTGILHSNFDLEGNNDRKDECLYVGVHELYAGLNFAFCDLCGCYDTYFQIGYEVQKFHEWREADSNQDLASLGFGGLTLRLGACF